MILKGTFPTEKFKSLATPFYFYDITLLKETLNTVKTEAGKVWLSCPLCSQGKCQSPHLVYYCRIWLGSRLCEWW